MKISVVTVAWNAEATIADTLSSVSDQRGVEYEHIIVDGGSTDATLSIVSKYQGKNVRVLSEPDRGIYDAMTKGLRLATGDVIGFLNSDDFFCRTDALSVIAEGLRTAPDCQAVAAAVAIVARDDPDRIVRHYPARGYHRWMARFGHMVPHPGLYVRRAAAEAVGGFDSGYRISGDFDWLVRFMYAHNFGISHLDDILVGMRQGGASSGGLSTLRVLNQEISRSLRTNSVASLPAMVWSKYLLKASQLLNRPANYPAPPSVRWSASLETSGPGADEDQTARRHAPQPVRAD